MGFADNYFVRFKAEKENEAAAKSRINNPDIIVVIPAYNEPDIEDTIISLLHNYDPECNVDIILVVNAPEDDEEEVIQRNLTDYQHYNEFAQTLEHKFINLTVLWRKYPGKFAGPGSARKTGMDIALDRFNKADKSDGIIISLDADAVVSRNYLKSIKNYFKNNTEIDGATIYFEHQYQEADDPVVLYEIYLRYFRHALEWSNYPHYFYSIGSCFAVKANTYASLGGMNRKNAGEDFYFLNKIELNGNLGECNKTVVYPSGRVSNRVPFGTGPEVKKIKEDGSYKVYSIESFKILSEVSDFIKSTYNISKEEFEKRISGFDLEVKEYFKKIYLWDSIEESRQNSSDEKSFLNRLFRYFDTFKVIRFLNYLSENKYPKKDVLEQSSILAENLNINIERNTGECILEAYRNYDRAE